MVNKLTESEQWYSTILKSIDEVVIITNIDRQITFMNPAAEALTGWKQEEANEKDFAEVVILNQESTQYFSDTSATSVIWKGAINGINAGLSSDFILKSKDGTETAIEYSASLIRNNNDEIIGVIFIFRDVTEKRQIADLKEKVHEQQLIQADKMISLGTLVAGVAHEINNPNNFIMLNTPILQDAWDDIMPILERYYEENDDFNIGGFKFTEMRNYIPKLFSGIHEGANRIKRIVSDLKDFARQEPVDMNQFVDVNFVVKSAITLVSNQIK
ncbi:MAG: PAS domain S-box protein, partial [Candidatus Anammoxibacter sp.]